MIASFACLEEVADNHFFEVLIPIIVAPELHGMTCKDKINIILSYSAFLKYTYNLK